jgi:hypothetical protein
MMGVFYSLGRLIERVITLAFAGGAGALVGAFISDGQEGAIAAGVAIGVGVVLFKWMIGGARRGVAKHVGPADLGTIVSITSQPPPGAPWYHHTYVLVDVKGKRRKLKLTPDQAREFSENYSEGDVGRIAYSGKRLLAFTPASPAAPIRNKTGIKAFISYAHGSDPESQMAEYVAEVLETSGMEPWVDKTELRPGQQLSSDLVKQIRKSDYFVPLLSKEYMTSEWCLREFETAAEAGISMKPIKITKSRLVPPPYMKKLYKKTAGDPVYLDMTSRHAPQKLRELAEDMIHRA